MKHPGTSSLPPGQPSSARGDSDPSADWLEQLLHSEAEATAPVSEGDFSARVLSALPPRVGLRQGHRRRWDAAAALSLISAMAAGVALALLMILMPGAVSALAQMGAALDAQGLQAWLQNDVAPQLLPVLVLGLGVVWWSWQQATD